MLKYGILPLSFLLLFSCASVSGGDWGPWKISDVSTDKQEWRFCKAELDGAELHKKGFCYISQECRERSTIFRNVKSECRKLPLVCLWGDIECLDKYNVFNKIIVNKEKL